METGPRLHCFLTDRLGYGQSVVRTGQPGTPMSSVAMVPGGPVELLRMQKVPTNVVILTLYRMGRKACSSGPEAGAVGRLTLWQYRQLLQKGEVLQGQRPAPNQPRRMRKIDWSTDLHTSLGCWI